MAYDEALSRRLTDLLSDFPEVSEKKMFGGLALLYQGNMCCGIVGDELMVRVGPEAYEEALAEPHARAMDFTGRPMKGMVYVSTAGIASDADLRRWVERGVQFAASLPAKKK